LQSDAFELKDFVEGLSRKLVFDTVRQERQVETVSNFDTEPFRAAFEGALAELRVLDSVLTQKLDDALERCVRTEDTFKTQMSALVQGQEKSQGELKDIYQKMSNNTASAIG
jgi:flagellar motility protein MotE (MotC chaperone)